MESEVDIFIMEARFLIHKRLYFESWDKLSLKPTIRMIFKYDENN